MTYESHKTLMDKIEKTGHAVDGGICYGFSSAAIMSLLCGGMEEFIKRLLITYISNEKIENLIAKLKALEKLTATGKIIAEEELKKYHLTAEELEWLAFCDEVMLAQSTDNYAYLFNKGQKIASQDFLSSSQFTLPLRFTVDNKNDFLDLIASFSGAYQHDDLVNYFNLFEEKIIKNEIKSFALHLNSSNHAIAVAFDANTMRWCLIDVNQIPPYSIALGHAEELADFVLSSFSDNENAIFQTHIYTKNSTSKPIKALFDQVKQETAWQSLHEINKKNANRFDSFDASWLYSAARYGDYDVVSVLIKSGADVNHVCDAASPLYTASENGHANVVKLLLESGADVNQFSHGITPLYIASQIGHDDVLSLLLKNGAAENINQLCDGFSPLYTAAENGCLDVVALLLAHGADINQLCNGYSPLSIASKKGYADVVSLLLANGAAENVNQLCDGLSPLWVAAGNGHLDVVELLIAKGALVNEVCNGDTPLFIASQNGCADVVSLLLKNGAAENINQLCDGFSPLYTAAENGCLDVVALLLAHGADINQLCNGFSPLWIASQNGHADVANLLLANGAAERINQVCNGATSLWIASQNGYFKIVQALLKYSNIEINISCKYDKKDLEHFAKGQEPDLQERMIQWINMREPENQQYVMAAQDIAYIMGHKEILQVFGDYEVSLQVNQKQAVQEKIGKHSAFSSHKSTNEISLFSDSSVVVIAIQ